MIVSEVLFWLWTLACLIIGAAAMYIATGSGK
jgi:hypothetical protein